MRTVLIILIANLVLLLPCCRSWGDEPQTLTDLQLPPLPQEFGGTGDESVGQVQAGGTPSPAGGSTGNCRATAGANSRPDPAVRTTPARRARALHSTAVPPAPTRRQPSRARPTPRSTSPLSPRRSPLPPPSMEPSGGFGELGSFGRGGTFQMIGDQSPIQAIHPAQHWRCLPRRRRCHHRAKRHRSSPRCAG